jgi:hypothetical protein
MTEPTAGPADPEAGDEGLRGDVEESDVGGIAVEELRGEAAGKAAGLKAGQDKHDLAEELLDELAGERTGRVVHTDWPGD